jgi:hypothetical protein
MQDWREEVEKKMQDLKTKMKVNSFKACKRNVLCLGRNQSVFTTSQEIRKRDGDTNNAKDRKVKINIGQKFAFVNL